MLVLKPGGAATPCRRLCVRTVCAVQPPNCAFCGCALDATLAWLWDLGCVRVDRGQPFLSHHISHILDKLEKDYKGKAQGSISLLS